MRSLRIAGSRCSSREPAGVSASVATSRARGWRGPAPRLLPRPPAAALPTPFHPLHICPTRSKPAGLAAARRWRTMWWWRSAWTPSGCTATRSATASGACACRALRARRARTPAVAALCRSCWPRCIGAAAALTRLDCFQSSTQRQTFSRPLPPGPPRFVHENKNQRRTHAHLNQRLWQGQEKALRIRG